MVLQGWVDLSLIGDRLGYRGEIFCMNLQNERNKEILWKEFDGNLIIQGN